MSLLRGIQMSALGVGAATRGRLPPLPPSCLAGAFRSRWSLLLSLSFLFLFLLLGGGGGALRSRFFSSAYATAAAATEQALGAVGAAARGRLPLLPAYFLAALRSRFRFSSAADPTAAERSLLATATGLSGTLGIDFEICGGIHDAPGREMDPDAVELARFAVAEHNNKTNAALELVRLVKVREQVVAGIMYYFTVEVRNVDGGAGANKLYEAKVWLKPWQKFKGLDAFEPVASAR